MKDRIEELKYKLNQVTKGVFAFVFINVIIFAICTFTGSLLYNKGYTGYAYFHYKKEWYRLVTSLFLHQDMEHLVSNMMILYFAGEIVEKASSTAYSVFLYFFCGISGNLVSVAYEIITQDYSKSIGASGAVFGYLGALISFVIYKRIRNENMSIPRVIGAVFISLYAGFSNSRVNNAAHIGGLISGLIVGMIYCIVKEKLVKKSWR